MFQGFPSGFKDVTEDFSNVPGVSGAFHWVSGAFQGFPAVFQRISGVLQGVRKRCSGFDEVSGVF